MRVFVHKILTLLVLVCLLPFLGTAWGVEKNLAADIYNSPSAESQDLHLTEAEKKWLADNSGPFMVHNEVDYPPFNYHENGQPKGFSIDYMNLLATKLGIAIHYVTGPSWEEFLQRAKDGQIDVMLNIVQTKERDAYLAFTAPYVDNPPVFVTRQDHKSIRGFADLAGKNIAVPKGFFYQEILEREYPEIPLHLTRGLLESLQAVVGGEAYAAVGGLAIENWLIQKYGMTNLRVDSVVSDPAFSNKLRIAVNKDRPLFRDLLQKAADNVSQEEYASLQRQWLPVVTSDPNTKNLVPLTPSERTWLESHHILRIGGAYSWPPFSFLDDQEQFSGISYGFTEILAKRLGVVFKPEKGMLWKDVIKQIKNRQLDIVPVITHSPELEKFINITKPYISLPVVIATRKDGLFIDKLSDLSNKRVGVIGGYVTHDHLQSDYPDIQRVIMATAEQGLRALAQKKVEAFVGNLGTITYTMDRVDLENIKIAAPTQYTFELSFGVRKDWPELVAILNKGLDTLDNRDRVAIKNAWMALHVQFGTDLTTIFMWAIPIGASLFLILGMTVFWNRRLGKEIEQRRVIERELRKLSMAVEDSPSVVVITNPEGYFDYVNPRFVEVTGYTLEEIRDKTPRIISSGLTPPEIYQDMWQTISSGRIWRGELLNRKKNGETYWVTLSISPVMQEGRVVHYVALQEDITAKKQAEKDLLDSQQRLNLALSSMSDGLFMLDDDLNYVFFNELYLTMLRLPDGLAIVGGPVDKVVRYLVERGDYGPVSVESFVNESLDKIRKRQVERVELNLQSGTVLELRQAPTSAGGIVVTISDITERKHHEERLNLALIGGNLGFWDVDLETGFTIINDRYRQIYGLESESNINLRDDWVANIHPDDREMVLEVGRRYRLGKEAPYEVEYRYLRQDGSVRWLVSKGAAVEWAEDGTVRRIVGTVADFTERKLMAEDLAKSQEQLQSILDNSPALIYAKDMQGRYVLVNKQWCETLGFVSDTVLGYTDMEIFSEEFARVFIANDKKVLQGGVALQVAEEIIQDDGIHTYISFKFTLYAPDGHPYGVCGISQDITQLKAAERKLADQLAFTQALVDTIPYPVFYKGADTRFLGCNRAYEEIFNIAQEAFIGKRVLDLDYLPEADRIAYQKEDEETIRTMGKIYKEMIIPFSDGNEHHTLYWVQSFAKDDGTPGGLVGTFVDIEVQKQAEQAMAEAKSLA